MQLQLEWIFDRAGPSGQKTGGKPVDQIVGNKISSLAREVTQNIRDQWLRNGTPAQARFSFIRLSGRQKTSFLKAMNWEELAGHIDGAVEAGGRSPISIQLRDAADSIRSEDLLLLRIDDFNTRGLLGGEDEDGTNFVNLCKNDYITPETGGRGGSYGLGKGVLHRFSSVSTVLYSSWIDGPVDGEPTEGLRLFGRTQLISHAVGSKRYNPSGWFGERRAIRGAGARAESVWGQTALCRRLHLDRDPADGTGTSILIVGFFDAASGSNAQPDPSVAAEALKTEIEKWFWPSISVTPASLEVEIRVISNGRILQSEIVDPAARWAHFIRAYEGRATSPTAEAERQLAEGRIAISVPERRVPPAHRGFQGSAALRVARVPESMRGQLDELDRVALVRGFGMVVKYLKPKNRPLSTLPFAAVLKAGTASGSGPDYQYVEEFLRACEPPLHDEWVHDTDSVRASYKAGARQSLQALHTQISDRIVDLCGIPDSAKQPGPALLSRLLPFGRSGKPSDQKRAIVIRDVDAVLEASGWRIRGRVLNAKAGAADWECSLVFFLDAEQGRGETLAFTQLDLSSGTVVELTPFGKIRVPADEKEIEFEGVLDTAGYSLTELKRIRLRYGS
ncbi:hypothetical protein [Microvirga yunnanensis]|uniref:hypothetical protein n=1 Tax=Microvirga yunnanensis TaxID=2953740 RepID=UPI0021CA6679|nr:hypothetical protein [Microvirga sp. HBU65207]